MPTLVIVRRPRTARSVTQTVRMRFLVGTGEVAPARAAVERPDLACYVVGWMQDPDDLGCLAEQGVVARFEN